MKYGSLLMDYKRTHNSLIGYTIHRTRISSKKLKLRISGLEILTFTLQEILFTLVKVNICILSSYVCPAARLQTGEMEYYQKLEGKHFIILKVSQDDAETSSKMIASR